MKILLIDDDINILQSTAFMLKKSGIYCDTAENGSDGIVFLQSYSYDLVLLDLLLPDMKGVQILEYMRKMQNKTPVLILSGLQSSEDKIECLNNGADDYIAKPYNKEELLARINAIIRRSSGYSHPVIHIGDLCIDMHTKQLTHKDQAINLTAKEYSIIESLALKKGRPVSKEFLLEKLYSGIDEPEAKIIDVFVCKVRKKIKDVSQKNYIKTMWGQGYILSDPDE